MESSIQRKFGNALMMAGPINIGPGLPRHRSLVFTSAGDHANLDRWLDGARDFDLWITYYGDRDSRFRDVADYYNLRKGSKFQNLYFIYQTGLELLRHYSAIMVMDDDILIGTQQINRLFQIREQFDLWLLQPAFRRNGKISWGITRRRPTSRIRFTNFVEMTCPLFRTDKLLTFLERYDPRLVGYGIDWWYLDTIGPDLKGHVAVVDEVSCVNPLDNSKGGRREIDKVQPTAERIAVWKEIQKMHGIMASKDSQVEYSRISKSRWLRIVSAVLMMPEVAYYKSRGIARRFMRVLTRVKHRAGPSGNRL